MRIIDAHVHLWDVDAHPLPWFRDDLGLPRSASTIDLGRELAASGVESAVAVQAADTVTEAQWLMRMAAGDARVRRVVVQHSPAPGHPGGLTETAVGAAAAGVRAAVPQFAADLSDVDGLGPLADHLGATGRPLELLIRPDQLAAAATLSRRHPATAIVVCHLGLGTRTADSTWRAGLRAAAAAPGVSAKVSGLGLTARGTEASRTVLREAFHAFGSERLAFGSDWPMSVRDHPYAQVLAATRDALPALSDAATRAFWSETADRLYASA